MQTRALLIDSFRLLISRKLFWITLVITALLVLLFGSFGFSKDGVSVLYGLTSVKTETDLFSLDKPWARVFYLWLMSLVVVGLWLTWGATILALISTTSIFPDFMASGAIDLVLSKPIGRLKIFAVKYLGALLFVVLQVTVFCVGVYICLGLRINEWSPKVFLAIPLVALFFSYLYAITVLVGVWTRSTLAALLATLLIWFALGTLQLADNALSGHRIRWTLKHELAAEELKDLQGKLIAAEQLGEAGKDRVARLDRQIEGIAAELKNAQEWKDELTAWDRAIEYVRAPLPKTGATIHILDRMYREDAEESVIQLFFGEAGKPDFKPPRGSRRWEQQEMQTRQLREMDEASVWYVIGSSLAFEFVLLGIAAFIFVRRDY